MKREESTKEGLDPIEVVDFKFVNNSDETIFITNASIEILNAQVDVTPKLTVKYSIKNGALVFHLNNSGWGKALVSETRLSNDKLLMFEEIDKPARFTIRSGEKRGFLKFLSNKIKGDNKKKLIELLEKRKEFVSKVYLSLKSRDSKILSDPDINTLLSTHEKWHIEEFFENLREGELDDRQKWHIDYFKDGLLDGVPINDQILVTLKYWDEKGSEDTSVGVAQTPYHNGGQLWWTLKGFAFSPHTVYYSLIPPKDIYAIFLSPSLVGTHKTYSVSHSIKGGEVDRFHLLFISDKSAEYYLRLRFQYNRTGELVSETFKIALFIENAYNPFSNIKDGQLFIVVDGKLELAL